MFNSRKSTLLSSPPPPLAYVVVHHNWAQPWPLFIFWKVYLCSPNTGTYIYFLKIYPVFPSFSGVIYVTLSLTPHPVFLVLANPTPILCLSSVITTSIYDSPYLYFWLLLPTSPHKPFQYDVKSTKTYVAYTNVQHLQENSKSASTKRGTIHEGSAPRKKSGNLYREKGSVYFYFDKCKFNKPLKWKKYWTRQTTHWSHIYQI